MRFATGPFALIFAIVCPLGIAAEGPTATTFSQSRNLVQNSSFEMDWMHNKVSANTRFMLLEQSDWGYAQSDGIPDSWVVRGDARLDASNGKFGPSSLRLKGEATQIVYICGVTDSAEGGNGYNAFIPLPADLQAHVRDGALHFGVWCRAENSSTEPTFSVTVEYSKGEKVTPKAKTATFPKQTGTWEYRSVDFPTTPELGIAHAAIVRLTGGDGAVWYDGVSCTQDDPNPPLNLLPNGAFTRIQNHAPVAWGKPEIWSWSRRDYYRFTGWSHEKGTLRGGAAVAEGVPGLQLSVFPGDNFSVKSDSIKLNQDEARPLRASARVWADNLRWFEIMAQDETGDWIPQQDFSGFMGTDENYRNRILGIGTHATEYVRKYFAPRKPVKQLSLFICVRGIDGRLMEKNVVGTARVQDVELHESGLTPEAAKSRGLVIEQTPKPAPEGAVVLDLGERLWGDSSILVANVAKALQPFDVIKPDGSHATVRQGERLALPDGGEAAEFPFRIDSICTNWEQQYRVEAPWASLISFGTPSSPLAIRLTSTYIYPQEKINAAINLNVARRSLEKEIGSLRILLRSPAGDRVLLETADPRKALWTPDSPRPAILEEGFADARNLIVVPIEPAGLPVHPSTDPIRDCTLVATLKDKAGKLIAEQTSIGFGFMQRPVPPALPEKIEQTALSPSGQMLVNGKPFFFRPFPLDKTDLGGLSRMHHFPKSHKILPLPFPKDLLFKPQEDAEWKQKVQAFVRSAKSDPKLFGYYFAHDGETSFWFDQWKEMAQCQREVTAWAKEADPNHLILSAEWLFGHGSLTPEAGKHFDFLDVIDVEPGLRWTPDSNAVRKLAGRPIAIVAGLETYYSQSPQLIRWRMYEALRQGASDIGICPSGMLNPKPETITFLRGLYGELAGLEPALTAAPPQKPSQCNNAAVNLWERETGGTRYIVAMRKDDKQDPSLAQVTLRLPAAPTKPIQVKFEGRTLPLAGDTFTDSFEEPHTVHVYQIDR